jgi:two-component system, NtrC family, sensor kinase
MPGQSLAWWNRIGVRLTAGIVVVTSVTMGLFVFLIVRSQRGHLVSEVIETSHLVSETIRSSTYLDMLADRRENVYQNMAVVARQPQIDRVRILNKEGRITFSTEGNETGRLVDTQAEACVLCHAADEPIVRPAASERSRIFERNGSRFIGTVTPVYNEPSCSTAACHAHPPSQQVIGVVDITMSLDEAERSIAQLERATLALSGIAVLGVAGLVTLFARRRVVRPVRHLFEATRRIAAGNFAAAVPIDTGDELGVLEHAFNDMASSLSEARAARQELLDSLERKVEERTAALRQAQERMLQAEKLSSLGRLAASVAHEINNPLAGILTYAKLLVRTLEDGAESDKAKASAVKQLKLVQRETERCSAIVRNLLDFARERELTLRPTSVNKIIDEGLVLVSSQARLQSVTLDKRLGDVPDVLADFGQIRQAVINIIVNACDAMPDGGTLTIETDLDRDEMVRMRIADTGTGIDEAHLTKILDPFFTTKPMGTGLGLSVVYGIVERHGGRLDIESKLGQGTSVTIRLPTVAAARPVPETTA